MKEDFKNAMWDQIWLLAIIAIFFGIVSLSRYYEEKYSKYARYMFSNKENFKVKMKVEGIWINLCK